MNGREILRNQIVGILAGRQAVLGDDGDGAGDEQAGEAAGFDAGGETVSDELRELVVDASGWGFWFLSDGSLLMVNG